MVYGIYNYSYLYQLWYNYGIYNELAVDGRNIQTPSILYNPFAPKVQCYCNLKCVSPNGRKKSNP